MKQRTPSTLRLSNGNLIRGEYTGYSFILNCHMFSAYNGDVHIFSDINLLTQ